MRMVSHGAAALASDVMCVADEANRQPCLRDVLGSYATKGARLGPTVRVPRPEIEILRLVFCYAEVFVRRLYQSQKRRDHRRVCKSGNHDEKTVAREDSIPTRDTKPQRRMLHHSKLDNVKTYGEMDTSRAGFSRRRCTDHEKDFFFFFLCVILLWLRWHAVSWPWRGAAREELARCGFPA